MKFDYSGLCVLSIIVMNSALIIDAANPMSV